MNRKKKLLRNIAILTVLSLIIFSRGLYFSPEAAFRSSERSSHYGPSEIVYGEDFSGGKYFIGKYDQWMSFSTINRTLGLFWRIGDQSIGIEVDNEKPLFYTWRFPLPHIHIFGILHDPSIDQVEVQLTDGTILTQKEFKDDMFLITSESEAEFKRIIAYDGSGNVLFEEERLR